MTVNINEVLAKLDQLGRDTKETRQRAKRLETRVTKFLETQGFDTQVSRCAWDADMERVIAPSRDVTLREVLDAIPLERGAHEVGVLVGTDIVAVIGRS